MSKPRTSSSRPPVSSARGGSVPSRAQPPGRPGSRLVLVIAAVVVALAVIAGVVFLAARDGGAGGAAPGGGVEIAHVHGLGVDPQDGALYAGTHYGLFRVPEDGEVTRVADRVQDFMGFTVVGPDHYLASGHPGEGQDGPSSLGLIETTDGGQTWQSLSLAGEADFHSLEARHGLIYGLNAVTGEFLVSEDKQSWDVRSQLPIADFAVSPENADTLVATTQQGLVLSADGGRTFEPTPAAPLLQLVAWSEDDVIIGVAPDGTVHASADDGQTWEQRGDLGASPHALAATTGDDVFAAVEGAILVSRDGGRSFDTWYRE